MSLMAYLWIIWKWVYKRFVGTSSYTTIKYKFSNLLVILPKFLIYSNQWKLLNFAKLHDSRFLLKIWMSLRSNLSSNSGTVRTLRLVFSNCMPVFPYKLKHIYLFWSGLKSTCSWCACVIHTHNDFRGKQKYV